MVVYALHFALRDLELRSQYHVQVENNKYLIDLYAPALKLAIEIDELYHFNAEQIEKDYNREQHIKEKLGCDFYRINCDHPIYPQVDRLITNIKKQKYDIWQFQRPDYQKMQESTLLSIGKNSKRVELLTKLKTFVTSSLKSLVFLWIAKRSTVFQVNPMANMDLLFGLTILPTS